MNDLTVEELRVLVRWGSSLDYMGNLKPEDQEYLTQLKDKLEEREQLESMDFDDCGDACKL